ncbi:MAG: ubiquinone biosynthesis methyltransferase UbiE [Rhodobacteraceae bacterium]|nr:MAG: ubiquinone biosynthesis methyltransferase UbiE [Paracoccaceae bacterium]
MPSDVARAGAVAGRAAFAVKWTASILQIAGYTATAFGWTPLNLHLFVAGVLGWFAVGVLWNDRAIMLIHLIALGAMPAGMSRG